MDREYLFEPVDCGGKTSYSAPTIKELRQLCRSEGVKFDANKVVVLKRNQRKN